MKLMALVEKLLGVLSAMVANCSRVTVSADDARISWAFVGNRCKNN